MWRRPSTAIVIGGGVAGTSIAKTLAERGVGVTVLEKAGQLCAGATWHAAGLVTRFGGSPKIKRVHVRALEIMTQMHREESVGLHLTGSIRLIEKGDTDRLLEAKQHVAMAKLYDDPAQPTSMLSPAEVAAMHPLVDVTNIECGVYTPNDGDVDPTMLTNAIAKRARTAGAQFRFNAEVGMVHRRSADGKFEVSLGGAADDPELLTADAVINCAGLWSRKFSNQLGMHHPAFVIEHQYAREHPAEDACLHSPPSRAPSTSDTVERCHVSGTQ
jgi:dimethylglycine dehydrogenase